ncbi:MAG: hypothetical protein R3E92_21240 [Burkholderiaceae bacterium]
MVAAPVRACLTPMKNTILSFNDLLYRICIWISGASIVIMALIIPWGIFTRYVLGTGSRWPSRSILLMVVHLRRRRSLPGRRPLTGDGDQLPALPPRRAGATRC